MSYYGISFGAANLSDDVFVSFALVTAIGKYYTQIIVIKNPFRVILFILGIPANFLCALTMDRYVRC
jgi:hypothetical protein